MKRNQARHMKSGEMVLAAVVVLMTAWVTYTVVTWLALGMAEAVVR